ncbi:hypothetical protein [Bradyrhizobium zhanjiangense]|uniref:hypothetical protein n=1 Tax=Bradyrhizobium zhanjiangense TaxID=1325107 RepID=UPI001FDF92A9|nr:hypothetical protein [Bradyrhizobium zhanjiangense]
MSPDSALAVQDRGGGAGDAPYRGRGASLDERQPFTDAYAIVHLSSGANVLIVTLMGYGGERPATDRTIAALLLTAMVAVIASVSRINPLWFLHAGGCWVLLALCDENR